MTMVKKEQGQDYFIHQSILLTLPACINPANQHLHRLQMWKVFFANWNNLIIFHQCHSCIVVHFLIMFLLLVNLFKIWIYNFGYSIGNASRLVGSVTAPLRGAVTRFTLVARITKYYTIWGSLYMSAYILLEARNDRELTNGVVLLELKI